MATCPTAASEHQAANLANQSIPDRLMDVLATARDAVQRMDCRDAFAAIDRAQALVRGM
jgi:hypothetical protein